MAYIHIWCNTNIVASESADKTSVEAHDGWFQLNLALSMVVTVLLAVLSHIIWTPKIMDPQVYIL